MSLLLALGGVALALLLLRRVSRRPQERPDTFLAQFHKAHELGADDRHAEALAALDAIDARDLPPQLMAIWLNNRAYFLALLGRTTEALAQLDDADALLDPRDEEGELDAEQTRGCITGTRGIALHLAGRHKEGEFHLRRALALGDKVIGREGDAGGPRSRAERALAAERWWWLAETYGARGDSSSRYTCLTQAAGITDGGRFAERARRTLTAN